MGWRPHTAPAADPRRSSSTGKGRRGAEGAASTPPLPCRVPAPCAILRYLTFKYLKTRELSIDGPHREPRLADRVRRRPRIDHVDPRHDDRERRPRDPGPRAAQPAELHPVG